MRRPPIRWDGFEIHPIKRAVQGTMLAETDESADFFTLFGVRKDELFAIGDYNSREDAEACLISIRMASDNTSPEQN